jgi:hypothetical protein
MKTNPIAHGILRIRVILVCAALAVIVGFELCVGASLAARMGQTTTRQTNNPAAPNLGMLDLMAAAR